MSLLDNVFNGAPATVDPAVITAINARLDAAEALNAAQQSELDALQATVTGDETAQAAVDAAQQAALDAQAALDTAQAAAIAATQALDATQATSINQLITRVNTLATDLHIADYTVGGAPLTDENFQDALEACIADAFSRSALVENTAAQWRRGYRVRIPEGVWTVTRQIVFAPPVNELIFPNRVTPGLKGAGSNQTILVVSDAFPSDKDAVIYCSAVESAGTTAYTCFWECSDFSLCCPNGFSRLRRLNGIHVKQAIRPFLYNLDIQAFQRANMPPTHGWGIKIDDRFEDTTLGVENTQHVYLYNVWVSQCQGGLYLRDCTPAVLLEFHANQNAWTDIVTDGSVLLYWCGGDMQGGGNGLVTYPNNWFACSQGHTRVMSGWNNIVSTGTGASTAAASGDSVTVSGLSGLDRIQHSWCWLQLEIATDPYNDTDLISGMYLITDVIDATSCTIRKGVGGVATGLTWKLRNCPAPNYVEVTGRVYHEGQTFAGVGVYRCPDGTGQPAVKFHGNVAMNFTALVESYQTEADIIVENNLPSTGSPCAVIARNAVTIRALDATLDDLDLDEYSREGTLCRSYGKIFASRNPSRFGGIYTATSLGAGRLRTLCREAGAVAILDTRVTSSIALSGTNVTGWTDVVNNITATLEHAGQYPTYSVSDSNFAGQPTITLTGGSPTTSHGLLLNLPASLWPTNAHWPCLLVIGRATHAQLDWSTTCMVFMTDDSNSFLGPYWNHAIYNGVGGVYSARLGQLLVGLVPATDPLYSAAHAVIVGGAGRVGVQQDSESHFSNFSYSPDRGWLGARPVTLQINTSQGAGNSTVSLTVGFIAAFPRGLSVDVRNRLLDACANEFGIAGR